MKRSVYSSSPWEERVAYCRAKRVGNWIAVSGTVANDDQGRVVGPNDLYRQTQFALERVRGALEQLGAGLPHVIRTRTFLTDMSRFDEFARAHQEAFEGVDPAATCVEVQRLVAPEFLVEIEVDAVVDTSTREQDRSKA